MEGAADWAATAIFLIVGAVALFYALDWLAGKAISVVNWLVRHE